jgi:lysyl-tRNA synthetase, class I
LQWKIDFGARWYSFGVDYEVYGKDHLPNEPIYRKVCQILGGKPPVNFTYEMFLSEDGAKISKSSGNGISVEDWLKYAPRESIALYMYQKPKTAKRLHFDVIPKAMDEYLAFVSNFSKQEAKQQIENPVFHVHFSDVPEFDFSGLTYSLILNLASACNPDSDDILWGFVKKYQPKLNKENSPLLAIMINRAINYYNDFIKANKKYRKANDNEKQAILKLKAELLKINENLEAKEIQNIVFAIGREFGYENNMKDWFSALYQILLGQETGPRMGSFIALYGARNFADIIDYNI